MYPWHCRSNEREEMIVEPRSGVRPSLFHALEQFSNETGCADLRPAKVIVICWSGAGSLAARLPDYASDRVLAGQIA